MIHHNFSDFHSYRWGLPRNVGRFYIISFHFTLILAFTLFSYSPACALPPTFDEHIISNSFNGAWNVFAIDLDRDGDMDILGAASDADKITW
jgi:hypothetical protein